MGVMFDKVAEIIFDEIVPRLENRVGVGIFARERAKFEGWLKVEVCESLLKHYPTVIPEKDRIDVTFDDWAIELKTVNTNYQYQKVTKKRVRITDEINEVIDDINKLQEKTYTNKAILFVVFPTTHCNKKWQYHLTKIRKRLKNIRHREFKFANGVPGVIYFGSL